MKNLFTPSLYPDFMSIRIGNFLDRNQCVLEYTSRATPNIQGNLVLPVDVVHDIGDKPLLHFGWMDVSSIASLHCISDCRILSGLVHCHFLQTPLV